MLKDLTFEDGLNRIGVSRILFEETLVPSSCGKNPNSTYRPGYDWLFTYERILAGVLEPWTAHLRYELIGEKGVLCEALSNAFCHGHRKNPEKPIELKIFLGIKGLIVRIKDSGDGFDLRRVTEEFKKGKSYFHLSGNGLKRMIHSEDFHIFFTDSGACFNLMYLFPS
jgi:hypothetical protein